MQVSIDYIPKIQARKIFTYAKEQLDILKNPAAKLDEVKVQVPDYSPEETVEEMETEEVTNYAEIIPVASNYSEITTPVAENKFNELSQDELFEKLQNYKKLLDNGLILQGEYDAYKKEILSLM